MTFIHFLNEQFKWNVHGASMTDRKFRSGIGKKKSSKNLNKKVKSSP